MVVVSSGDVVVVEATGHWLAVAELPKIIVIRETFNQIWYFVTKY